MGNPLAEDQPATFRQRLGRQTLPLVRLHHGGGHHPGANVLLQHIPPSYERQLPPVNYVGHPRAKQPPGPSDQAGPGPELHGLADRHEQNHGTEVCPEDD